MTTVAVLHEPGGVESTPFRAISGSRQAMGRTAGEALDALSAQLPAEATETLVIVRELKADRFFGAEHGRLLKDLMILREQALAGRGTWTPENAADLERLVEMELHAATERAEALARELGK